MLKLPGRSLRPGESAPGKIVRYVASQIGEDPRTVDTYASRRDTIRREHLSQIMRTFGFRPFDEVARRELSEWLAPVAASTDSGITLMEALLEEMRRRRIVAPALYAVEELAWEVRRDAGEEVAGKLTANLSSDQLMRLDELLTTGAEMTRSSLVWLRQPPGEPAPKNFHKVIEKLHFVRSLSLSTDAARTVHHNRLSRLAAEGARMPPQNLFTLEDGRRRATLVAYLLQRAASLADEALEMHERMMNRAISDSRRARDETAREQGKKATETLGRYAGIGRALIIARERGLDPYEALEDFMRWETFVESVEGAEEAALRSSGALDYLRYMEDHYKRLRKYAALLLESFDFEAVPPQAPLLEAVEVLKEMNEKGKRKVPENAPTGLVKPGWEPHVFNDNGTIDRRNYEMSLISVVKDGLMSGDVWVSGSNKYKDFEDYLIPRPVWERMRASGDPPVAVEPDVEKYLEERNARLHEELSKVSRLLGEGKLLGVRLEKGEI